MIDVISKWKFSTWFNAFWAVFNIICAFTIGSPLFLLHIVFCLIHLTVVYFNSRDIRERLEIENIREN